jgi:hypothetical protein
MTKDELTTLLRQSTFNKALGFVQDMWVGDADP